MYIQSRKEFQMELFILFLVVAVIAGVWINYVLNKREERVVENQAPYKIDPIVETNSTVVTAPLQEVKVEPAKVEPVAEAKTKITRVKKPVKAAKTATSKPVTAKKKTVATKASKK